MNTTTRVGPPKDSPPAGCTETKFAVWASRYREQQTAKLLSEGINPYRVKIQVDLEIEAARRRSRAVESEVRA